MIDSIKKSLLAGVGAAIVTKEKVAQALDEFVREGKLTAQDAQRMADKVAAQGRKEFHEACTQMGEKLRVATSHANRAAIGQLGELEKRLRSLETKLGGKAPAAKAAPKSRRRPKAKA